MRNSSLLMALIASVVWVGGIAFVKGCSRGKVVVSAEKIVPKDRTYRVVVRREDAGFRTELFDGGDYALSTYSFYGGSAPATNAVISWPTLGEFVVQFDNGENLSCSWDPSGYRRMLWERK